jgi:TetR/AcrR family transcriptional regulator, transcriptional repressor for nem operon
MRQSREEKAKTHERILEIASRRIRDAGLEGPSVAELMQAAGLTHGGFYKHFGSRDDLIAEAAERAFADSERAVLELTDEAEDPLGALIDWYVSTRHRDDAAAGCPVVALSGDARRGDERVRAAYRRQVERYVATLERLMGGGEDARRRATVALSTLVGAVVLARAVDDEALSDEILRDVRDALTPRRDQDGGVAGA